MSRLVFVDCESTGLDPRVEQLFELAVIEEDGTEHVWRLKPSPDVVKEMHPKAVEVNRYFERTSDPEWKWDADELNTAQRWADVLHEIAEVLDGAHIVGAVPDFDARFIDALFHDSDVPTPRWHYHLLDIESVIVGWMLGGGMMFPDLPWDSEYLSAVVGVVSPDDEHRHTALGDARWVRDMWTRVTS